MHSATSFTLNTITQTENGEQIEYSGGGSYSANTIVLQVHKKTATSENDYTYTATKQLAVYFSRSQKFLL